MSLAAGLLLNEGSALLIIANGLRLLRRPARQPAAEPATATGPEGPARPGQAPVTCQPAPARHQPCRAARRINLPHRGCWRAIPQAGDP